MPRNSAGENETYWSEFTYGGLRYVAFPEFGGFFGADGPPHLGRPQLVVVPMLENGAPDLIDGVPNAGDVCVIEDPKFLPAINREFKTIFTIQDFQGGNMIKVTCNACEMPILITAKTEKCPLCGKTFWIEVKRA